MNKSQAHKIIELYNAGGAVPASAWTVGSGSYTTRAAMPEGSREYVRGLSDLYPKHVQAVFEERPRVNQVIGLESQEDALRAAVEYLTAKKYTIPRITGPQK